MCAPVIRASQQREAHDRGVAAGKDIGENASVWVLCQMNNAIGRGRSDAPSAWDVRRRSSVTHGRRESFPEADDEGL